MAATIVYRLTGGIGNSNPNLSLGGATSSTAVSGTTLHNLFDKVLEAERQAGSIEYRAIDLVNTGDEDTTEQNLYIETQTTSTDTSISIGYDATAGSHATIDVLELLASKTTAPADPVISFSEPTSNSPIELPAIVAGEAIRVFIRWTVDVGSTSFPNDSATLRLAYL